MLWELWEEGSGRCRPETEKDRPGKSMKPVRTVSAAAPLLKGGMPLVLLAGSCKQQRSSNYHQRPAGRSPMVVGRVYHVTKTQDLRPGWQEAASRGCLTIL